MIMNSLNLALCWVSEPEFQACEQKNPVNLPYSEVFAIQLRENMPKFGLRLIMLSSLILLPLQEAQAFFCFKFAMGNKSHSQPRYSRHYLPNPYLYSVPHPSYFLRNDSYLAAPTNFQPTSIPSVSPASSQFREISTPQSGM